MTLLRLAIALVALLLVTPAGASIPDDTCLLCHADVAASKADTLDLGPHARVGMGCSHCHADLAGVDAPPHPDAKKVQCANCHPHHKAQIAPGPHGAFECSICHGSHEAGVGAVECARCHGEPAAVVATGAHAEVYRSCQGCHGAHAAGQATPTCASCHGEISRTFFGSIHGKDVAAGVELAPRCWTCHGDHDIAFVDDRKGPANRFNVPFLCGRCHKEGTEVTRTYDIPQDQILQHYTQSIHGVGLYEKGLVVSAVCSDCHTAHNSLPHDDPRSSIHRDRVAETCQLCHARIEEVHERVIQGALWETQPNKVPVCVDCHQPHEARRVYYGEVSDAECLSCHGDPGIAETDPRLQVHFGIMSDSVHRAKRCAQCHLGADPEHPERSCSTIEPQVDCSICHAEAQNHYDASVHAERRERGDPDAPYCTDCHGTHGTLDHKDPESPTHLAHVPELCGDCHRNDEVVGKGESVGDYWGSAHGKGLLESGLVVTATCTDCHTPHLVLPTEDTRSAVHPDNVAETCGECHAGIARQLANSIHSPEVSDTTEPLPTCGECHGAHAVTRVEKDDFLLEIIHRCGTCHEDVTESYYQTFHGKVNELGFTGTAKCEDCHGSHNILPPTDTRSMLSRENIVATCGACHPGSHRQFAGYLTHATHHDKDKYPVLFYTFWGMTLLLVGTFSFFGLHTVLWLPRALQRMLHHRKRKHAADPTARQLKRFPRLYRFLHFLVIISFIALALTGMTLKFSYLGWAAWLSRLFGGYEAAAMIHRLGAIITFVYFGVHVSDLVRKALANPKKVIDLVWGEDSMVPNLTDLREIVATFKWFLHLGPRPEYGRWTYWEKFDYFAVFWGVGMIGMTGLILWFPEAFTYVLPGWMINVATIIHSDEALLATGFIFTVHFFNTHFRPDAFPMDTVIFTGRVDLEEFKEDRPREYRRLVESGTLEDHLVEPLPPYVVTAARVFGFTALTLGIALILLIIGAGLFGYH